MKPDVVPAILFSNSSVPVASAVARVTLAVQIYSLKSSKFLIHVRTSTHRLAKRSLSAVSVRSGRSTCGSRTFCGSQRHFHDSRRTELTEESFEHGFSFDGSSMRGWQAIHESDMLIVPGIADLLRRSVHEIDAGDAVQRQGSGDASDLSAGSAQHRPQGRKLHVVDRHCGSSALFGAEAEFFVFDSVRFDQR
jgi:hypothetical protein